MNNLKSSGNARDWGSKGSRRDGNAVRITIPDWRVASNEPRIASNKRCADGSAWRADGSMAAIGSISRIVRMADELDEV